MKRQTPKKPSGAEFKRRKKDAQALARKLLAHERASGRMQSNLVRYVGLGKPSADALANIYYANRCAAELLHTVMNDAEIDEASRRKSARELIQAIGLTGVKALYERKLRDLAAKVYREPRAGDELEESD